MNPNYPERPTQVPQQPLAPAGSTGYTQAPPVYQAPYPQTTPVAQPATYQQPTTYAGTGAPIDYLNQIAAPIKPTRRPGKLVMIIAILSGLLIVALFAGMILNSQPSQSSRLTDLYLRMQTLQSLSDTEQKLLKDNDLRTTNSNSSLILADSIRDIKGQLTKFNVNPDKIDKSLTSKEEAYKQKLADEFTNAKLNVSLDRTYAREMAYQISILTSNMKTIYNSTNSASLKTFLESSFTKLATVQQRFENFTAAQE